MRTNLWNAVGRAFMNPITEHKALHLARPIAELAQLDTARNVLEVASGAGYAGVKYASMLPEGGRIVVTDLAQVYSEFWNAQPRSSKIHYEVADAVALQYKNESFDRYICCSGVTQFYRPDLAFKEAYRVLRPGSILVANMPVSCSYEESFFYYGRDRLHLAPYDPTELICTFDDPMFLVKLCEDSGFENVKVFYDVVSLDIPLDEFFAHIVSILGPVLASKSPEVVEEFRTKTLEVARYYMEEKKELIHYKTVGV
eukprot:CAMPEP_0204908306 /NCGR_PEP_ID=MMETSP1397-20131031/7278_1 /ASSEMBLY_ACC=CAM_ASM_000891 /TAXON_ID=49980 /ORGANISM="Climacostomum Climacostomum virens, Strain Stock W-24" /LENGTH=255 /DNA_ID=CAMNT_0052077773 /DNA_START=519 /DNA_END=1283 /DNA_ORIENTATION=-